MSSKNIITNVEKASDELFRGGRVKLFSGRKSIVVSAYETSDDSSNTIILTPTRAKFITGKKYKNPVAVNIGKKLAIEADVLVGIEPKEINFRQGKEIAKHLKEDSSPLYKAALKLSKIAELLPAVNVHESKSTKNILTVDIKDIGNYETTLAKSLKSVCTAPLTLENAKKARVEVFRSKGSKKEHYAIIVGNPSVKAAPLVRVHSCCFTGDVLASLRCDCRDQLQSAFGAMSKDSGGGILLYLMQEGRGIGLINKLRTYSLQAKGMDTVEANKFLGFDDDERPFLPAARILKELGFNRVRLMTNNPRKVAVLEEHGIKIVERVAHLMDANKHNEAYMDTKFDKMGHLK